MEMQQQADRLVQKIKHHLITTSGHRAKGATTEEFYQAFCSVLREEIMVNQTATIDTIQFKKPRMVNFLSMEYLPGRLMANHLCNMNALELVKIVLQKMGRALNDLISCETDPGLGSGGLGRLSACFLDSLATLKYPARGYGLRYQYGIFEQEIWDGVQVERPDCWLLMTDPWELRRDIFAVDVHFRGRVIQSKNQRGENIHLLEDYEAVRAIPFDMPIIGYSEKADYSVLLLRLWSTKESPRNFQLQRYNAGLLDQAAENTSLTDVLYPNDNSELGKRIRLKQEFLLVSASLQDIIRRHLNVYGDLSSFADKVRIQINDTHPALIVAELVRSLTKNYHFSWKEAWETCQACCSYTNHTILREALEEWNEQRFADLIPRQLYVIQRINQEFCNQVRARFPQDEEKVRKVSILENGQVRMAHLAILGSHRVNGVAKLHSEIIKKTIFKDFADLYPDKFTNVTNGVTQRRWLLKANPLLAAFITERIGKGWICDFSEIKKLAQFASDPSSQREFLAIKRKNKEALLSFLTKENGLRDALGKKREEAPFLLGPDALFTMQIKRIHEYKRQLLNALHLIMLLQEPPRSPPRLAIFAGTAAPGYTRAKQIIQLLAAIARKCRTHSEKKQFLCVVFVENYNVSQAEILIPAADLSEQISAAGWEASGTGNMKLAMNGALTVGTEDGANIEMRQAVTDRWWPFRFGSTLEENQRPYTPWDTYANDEKIRQAVDTLQDGTLAENPAEREAFQQIYQNLVEEDPFRVLKDLRPYYETQRKAEALYQNSSQWAETALHNIAAMGPFSTDASIRHYAKEIWGLTPCPLDEGILAKVREEYADHDACRLQESH